MDIFKLTRTVCVAPLIFIKLSVKIKLKKHCYREKKIRKNIHGYYLKIYWNSISPINFIKIIRDKNLDKKSHGYYTNKKFTNIF